MIQYLTGTNIFNMQFYNRDKIDKLSQGRTKPRTSLRPGEVLRVWKARHTFQETGETQGPSFGPKSSTATVPYNLLVILSPSFVNLKRNADPERDRSDLTTLVL